MDIRPFWIVFIIALPIIGRVHSTKMKKVKERIGDLDDKNAKITLAIIYDMIMSLSNFLLYLITIIYLIVLLISKQIDLF